MKNNHFLNPIQEAGRKVTAGEWNMLVRLLMLGGEGGVMQSEKLAKSLHATERVQLILKAAVTAGSTTSLGALAEYGSLQGAFIESLGSVGAFDRMYADM